MLEKNVHWNLPPSDGRQHFVVTRPSAVCSKTQELLKRSLGVESLTKQRIDDTYYDTKSFALLSNGYACCIRKMLGRFAICLIPVAENGANDASRSSLVASLFDTDASKSLKVVDLESSEIKSLLVKLLGQQKLIRQFRVRTKREHFEYFDSSESVPLILDRVTINSCRKSGTMNKFSISYDELVLGADVGNTSLMRRFNEKLKTRLSLQPLRSNAYQRAIEVDRTLQLKSQSIHSSQAKRIRSGHDLFRAHMKTQLADLKSWESVAIEGNDEEGVHQMRVSIRRIRAALKTFSPLIIESEATHWHTEFRWLAQRLGGVRDLDVFTEWLEQNKSEFDDVGKSHLMRYQNDVNELYHHARQGLLGSIDSERYQSLLTEFQSWLDQEQCFFVNNDLMWKPTKELSDALVKRAVRRINRKIKAINKTSPAEQLHRFRVECKRARYSLEMLENYVGNDHKPLVGKLKQIQEILGDHQDAFERSKRIRLYANGKKADAHGQDFVFFLGTLFAKQEPILSANAKAFFNVQDSAQQIIKQSLKSKH